MQELKVKQLPIGWHMLSSEYDSLSIAFKCGTDAIMSKIRLQSFIGRPQDLEKRITTIVNEYDVIDCIPGEFLCNNLKWQSKYFVRKDENSRYNAIFYVLLDGYYLAISMCTKDSVLRTRFLNEAKRIIYAIDCSNVKKINQFSKGGNIFKMDTPKGFQFSDLSNDTRLVFTNENQWLFVNVGVDEKDLFDYVADKVSNTFLGLYDCNAFVEACGNEDDGTKWVRYVITSDNNVVGYGTYFSGVFINEPITNYHLKINDSEEDRAIVTPDSLVKLIKINGGDN